MAWKGKDIISIHDFSDKDLLFILDLAERFENERSDLLKGRVLATLFFEPSTRTRLSFTSAMEQLGGSVMGFSSAGVSSTKKGETLWDTIQMVEKYSDAIVIRHPVEGSARLAADSASIPVINAGDGANQHPTQTLLDLYTIKKSKGTIKGLSIGMLGDLKYGRTVHSLTTALSHFGARFYFIAPDALKMPKEYLEDLEDRGISFTQAEDLFSVSDELDILYVTRIQQERFADPLEYERYKDVYRLDSSLLPHIKPELKIMHPLPRVSEISPELDKTPHAIYFEQAKNGLVIRKALISLVMGAVS